LLKATSNITNNTAPNAESETRFTLTWSIGRGAFVGWSEGLERNAGGCSFCGID
jgi:hypothetical protein